MMFKYSNVIVNRSKGMARSELIFFVKHVISFYPRFEPSTTFLGRRTSYHQTIVEFICPLECSYWGCAILGLCNIGGCAIDSKSNSCAEKIISSLPNYFICNTDYIPIIKIRFHALHRNVIVLLGLHDRQRDDRLHGQEGVTWDDFKWFSTVVNLIKAVQL